MNQTAPKTTWLQGLIFSLLGLAMWCIPHSAHADLRSLIKDLQQCQRSGQQLKQCQQNKQALTNQIQALQKQLAAKNSQIAKLRRKLGLAPDPKEMAKRFANHPAAAAERKSVTQLAGSPSHGANNALVTIVEFSDFQCPYCSRGAKVMDQVKKAYGNKVRIVFKHLPLSFHKQAHIAAQASMEAHAQGKFWQYHDKLFANSRSINKANLIKWAKELGLDAAKMKAALDSGKYKKYVDNDLRMAGSLGVRGTPNFFVNGQKIVGAQPFSRFKQVIDSALRK
jgi:protein-disulfide isomerase